MAFEWLLNADDADGTDWNRFIGMLADASVPFFFRIGHVMSCELSIINYQLSIELSRDSSVPSE